MSLKSIKEKIRGVDKAHKVTKAMEAVSAVKMRHSQERALEARPYAVHALSILKRISGSVDAIANPLMLNREIKKTCIVSVTSDKGLAGNLNNAVIKKITREMESRGLDSSNTIFVCLGRRGFEYFSKRGYAVERYLENLSDAVSVADMKEVSDFLAASFMEGKCDECLVFYTNFVSTFEQAASMRKVLPIDFRAVEEVVKGILPVRGKYAKPEDGTKDSAQPLEYIFEPDQKRVLAELVPHLLNIEMYHVLLESKASEHSSRMVAMKNASDKAEEMSDDLNLKFNKERQTLITREVSEIVGGIEAMAK